jgi:hypothetical protein
MLVVFAHPAHVLTKLFDEPDPFTSTPPSVPVYRKLARHLRRLTGIVAIVEQPISRNFERICNPFQSLDCGNCAAMFQPRDTTAREAAPSLQVGLREILGFALLAYPFSNISAHFQLQIPTFFVTLDNTTITIGSTMMDLVGAYFLPATRRARSRAANATKLLRLRDSRFAAASSNWRSSSV